jgi:hypothetical protein
MLFLASRAYVSLLRFEASLVRGRFDSLYDKVRNHPVSKCPRDEETTARVCQAVDLACIWYWKQVLCLQRSAATVCLLRDNGVFAELVIGAQHMPFRAHAWVEVQGRIVNDKAYTSEIYAVLDRC